MSKLSKYIDGFMKVMVFVIVLHGLLMITWSYVLATVGVLEPLQELSKTIVTEIVAPIVIYGLTKTVENVFKYNDVFGNRGVTDDSDTMSDKELP